MSITFQSFWWGGGLTPYEWLCLQSFVRNGHAFNLYSFDRTLSVPSGVEVCDATEIFSEKDFFVYSEGAGHGSPAGFSDLFRYKLLVEKGGWWIDTDVVCLSAEIPAYRRFFAFEDTTLVNGAVLYFQPHDPIMVRCLQEALILGKKIRYGEVGPRLLTRVLREQGVLHLAQEAQICYPLFYTEFIDTLRPQMLLTTTERLTGSLFLHLWNEGIRRYGISKKALPPKGSLLRGLIDQYKIEGWDGEYNGEAIENIVRLMEQLRAKNAVPISSQSEPSREKLLNSTSWRVTAPLRIVVNQMRRLLTGKRESKHE